MAGRGKGILYNISLFSHVDVFSKRAEIALQPGSFAKPNTKVLLLWEGAETNRPFRGS